MWYRTSTMFCLKVPSDPTWASFAEGSLAAILADHAHCEMKAATNALSLAARHPQDLGIVRALVDVAREELDHFSRVVDFLEARGIVLGPPDVDTYAAKLRAEIGKLPPSPFPRNAGLVDRLLVAALIEARSCERFRLLLDRLDRTREAALAAFYEELFAVEARHYTDMVDRAVRAAGGAHERSRVVERLELLSVQEGRIVRELAAEARATIHG